MTALLGAQQIARAADFQVAHGDFEAAAERRVLLDCADALASVGQKTRVPRQQQIGVGLMLVTPHPTAQLIEIAQAEPIGAIDDDGVGVRDIQAAFDDRRREQHVGLAVDKPRHHLLQVIAVQLPVPDHDARVRDQRLELSRNRLDGHDPVVQEKDLAAPVQLALDGVADHAFVVLRDDGLHRQAVLGRRLDGAHVAGAGERQVKSPRNGGGAQSQHVHQSAQQFELLFLHHSEALFLVDDDQAQIFESDVLLDQSVRADDDVHRAGSQVLNDPLLLAARAETGEQLDAHRIIRHALAERVEVLLRKHGGGHEHGYLPAVHYRFKRGANSHFGFAKADVTADQPIHGLRLFHVHFGFQNRAHLV